ncbi:MAG: hypothetical protein IT369_20805, partial [Candidatus Latescibacteria bacterium]|nr:hypothetical protein [Candidatus Latescibacterota bacterium]
AVIVAEFRQRFFDPELHFDRFSKSIFAHLIRAHEQPLAAPTHDQAHQHIEEAQLVIEAAYTLYDRMAAAAGVPS